MENEGWSIDRGPGFETDHYPSIAILYPLFNYCSLHF